MTEKKLYEKPTIQVVQVKMSQMLCVSGGETNANVQQMDYEEDW